MKKTLPEDKKNSTITNRNIITYTNFKPHKPVRLTIVTDEDDTFTNFETIERAGGDKTKPSENTSNLNLPASSESNVSQQLPNTSWDMQRAMSTHIHPNVNMNTMNKYNQWNGRNGNRYANATYQHSKPYLDQNTFSNVFNVNSLTSNGDINQSVCPNTVNHKNDSNINPNIMNNQFKNNINEKIQALDKIASNVLQYFQFLHSAASTNKHKEKCKEYRLEIFLNCYQEVLNVLVPYVSGSHFNNYVSIITTIGKNTLPLNYCQIYDFVLSMRSWTINISKRTPPPAKPRNLSKSKPPAVKSTRKACNTKKSECIFKSKQTGEEVTITVVPNMNKTNNNINGYDTEHKVHIQDASASHSHQEMLRPLACTILNAVLNRSDLDITRVSAQGAVNQIEVQSSNDNRKRTQSGDRGFTKAYVDRKLLSKNHVARIGSCAVCSKTTRKKCVACIKVFYCSIECQKIDWCQHKLHCVKVKPSKMIYVYEKRTSY